VLVLPVDLEVNGQNKFGTTEELCAKPLLGRSQNDKLLGQNIKLCPCLGVVEHDEDITDQNPVAFLHPHLLDDPAIEVLNALSIAIDLYDTIPHDGSVQGSHQRPGS
jgi:hypothetical protein